MFLERITVRIINAFEGNMELAGHHIRDLHAAHVANVKPARDRMIALDQQLSELLDRENELRAKRLRILRDLRQKALENAQAAFETKCEQFKNEIAGTLAAP